jgi:hypothetical protein
MPGATAVVSNRLTRVVQTTSLIMEGEGHQLLHHKDGSVVFVVQYAPHPRFQVEGINLVYTDRIKLVDALLGFSCVCCSHLVPLCVRCCHSPRSHDAARQSQLHGHRRRAVRCGAAVHLVFR